MPPLHRLHVLVTGAGGSVGTALVEALLDAGATVTGADRGVSRWSERVAERTVEVDLRDPDAFAQLPSDVDAVLHLAANSRVMDSLESPREGLENLETTFRTLEWVRREDAPRFVFASSREVYGSLEAGRARPGDLDLDRLANPYAASKVGGEAMLEAWSNAYGLDAAVLRLSNVYGRYDTDRVVPLFVAQAWDGRDLVVYGGEGKVLDLVHVDDVSAATLATLRGFGDAAGGTYNVASGEPARLLDVARWIAEASPEAVEVRTEPGREGEVRRFVADVEGLREAVGWAPEVSLEEGLRDAADWYGSRPEVREEILA